jgi:hypothetical protein
VTGVITEDRGPLAGQGRHIYRVLATIDPDESMDLELIEDDLEPAPDRATLRDRMDMSKVESYLRHGGLLSILSPIRAMGRGRPRIWLRPDTLGNVTYTSIEERGVLGGEIVPSDLLRRDKIIESRRDEAIAYIRSFGLDREAAERIVAAVGTAP